MKKIISILGISLLLTGCTALDDIQQTVNDVAKNAKEDIQGVQNENSITKQSGVKTLNDEMNRLNDMKNAELKAIDKQISEKEGQIAKVLINTKLSASQKKAKTSVLQKDIQTLKAQKEKVVEKYRNEFRNFGY